MHRKLCMIAQFSVQSRLDLFHDLFLNSINKYIAIQFDTKTTILYYFRIISRLVVDNQGKRHGEPQLSRWDTKGSKDSRVRVKC